MAKKTKKAAPQSRETAGIKSFLDMIAPSVVKFEPDHFICGNTFRCVWALREYPTQTDEQELKKLLGIYFEQNVTTEQYEDHDGERWVIFGD